MRSTSQARNPLRLAVEAILADKEARHVRPLIATQMEVYRSSALTLEEQASLLPTSGLKTGKTFTDRYYTYG